ncbi:hypothetical protein Ciccas_006132 [Cichlidogyrus casuarinus]|uniref:Uncharacterized protein n=1 Tax=Cichlidogyrus casuarinus TaxID=1844966 RepID=A0ABD2Q6M7_9PLAT
MTIAERLGSISVASALESTKKVEFSSFWQAVKLSCLKPALDEKNVRLIAVGFDTGNLQNFLDGKFFKGELFLDPEKASYKALDFEVQNKVSGMANALSSTGRGLASEASKLKIASDFKGDGWQKGGLLLLEKNGDVLHSWTQKNLTDNPDYDAIKTILDLNPKLIVDSDKWQSMS